MCKKFFVFSLLFIFATSLFSYAQANSNNNSVDENILISKSYKDRNYNRYNNKRSSNTWENIKETLEDRNRQNNYNYERDRYNYRKNNYYNNNNHQRHRR